MENIISSTSGSDVGSATATFRSGDLLLGIVQRAKVSGKHTRIVLAGKGELAILPALGVYYTNTQDLTEFCRTPAMQFEVSEFGEEALPYEPGSKKNLNELLWQIAFHASQGRLIEGCSKYDVVKFRHWPNLTRLPITPNTARICALLTRNQTTIMLVHRVLGIDKEEVYQIYSAASSAGLCHKIGSNLESANAEADLLANQPQPAKEHSLFRSLFAKISGL